LTFHQHQQMTSTMKKFFAFYHFTPAVIPLTTIIVFAATMNSILLLMV
jgi:hypothetical protein